MKNSYRYFENRECEYYPCHYKYVEVNGKKIKECTDCTFPHVAENYEVIMKFLSVNECISKIE